MRRFHKFRARRLVSLQAAVLLVFGALIAKPPAASARIAPAVIVSGDPTIDEGPQSGPKKAASSTVVVDSSPIPKDRVGTRSVSHLIPRNWLSLRLYFDTWLLLLR
jgi:hypothetical protein